MCARLLVVALILWGAYLEHRAVDTLRVQVMISTDCFCFPTSTNASVHITTMQHTCHQPFVNTIALAMDVESNPGPDFEDFLTEIRDDVLAELRDFRKATDEHFLSIKSEVSRLKKDVDNMRKEVDSMEEKVKQTNHEMDGMYDELYKENQNMKSRLERLERNSNLKHCKQIKRKIQHTMHSLTH